jgi:hypothetical protein
MPEDEFAVLVISTPVIVELKYVHLNYLIE